MDRILKFKFILKNKEGKKTLSNEYTLDEIMNFDYPEKVIEDMDECSGASGCQINGFCECTPEHEDYEIIGKIQFTGITDHLSGSDVYEGSTFHFTYGIPIVSANSHVEFIGGMFKVISKGHNPEELPLLEFFEVVPDAELIGNLYETKGDLEFDDYRLSWLIECQEILIKDYGMTNDESVSFSENFDDEQIKNNTPLEMIKEEYSNYDV